MSEIAIIWLVTSIVMSILAAAGTTAWCVLQYKQIQTQRLALQNQAHELSQKTLEFNTSFIQLHEMRSQNQKLVQDIDHRKKGLEETISYNKHIISLNEEILKKNAVEGFFAKENLIYLAEHYSKLVETVDMILMADDEDNSETLYGLQQTAKNNLIFVNNRFIETFRCTIEQYKKEKMNLTGKRPDGTIHLSQFSKN